MSEKAPGFEEYTPSRLEWLAMMLNSFLPYTNIPLTGTLKYDICSRGDGKTLILRVRYSKDTDSEIVQQYIENGKLSVKEFAAIYKWDSWVQIQVERDAE